MIKFIRIFLLILIIVGCFLLVTRNLWVPKVVNFVLKSDKPFLVVEALPETDFRNSTFRIEGDKVTLQDGVAVQLVPGSGSAMATVRYLGFEAKGDLDHDKKDDFAFLVTSDNGGTGTFYYVVAALDRGDIFRTTNAFFVGDRITPENLVINSSSGELQVYFLDRKKGEPMTTKPSAPKVLLLKVNDKEILEGLMK